jgi:hypothetical protein
MTREVPSDDLGEAGEALFAYLSARASLTCNKSNRDRTGWDFVVEFAMPEPTIGVTLDERSPTACTVQLKSTAAANPVKLRLSAAERLAKDLRPAFIIVFRLTPAGEPRSGYLIHLLGSALRRILHRLRIAHAKKDFDVNRTEISFDYRKLGTRFPLTPDGLRQALLDACGSQRAAYVTEKQRQLDELGYEDGDLEAEAQIWIESADHLSDIALGLAPVQPKSFRAFDIRFGIRVPYAGPMFEDIEDFRIEPPSVGPCVVAIRGPGLSTAAMFDAEILIGLPREMGAGTWMMVRHSDFILKFGSGSAAFSSTGEFDTVRRSLSAWIMLTRALAYLASGDSVTSLMPAATPGSRIELTTSEKLDGPYLTQLPEWERFFEGWERLLSLAGMRASEPFSLQDIWAAKGVELAVELFREPQSRAMLAFDRNTLIDMGDSVEAIYINTATLAGASVSYGVKVTLEARGVKGSEFRSTRFQALDVRPAVPDLQDYAEELASEHGIKIIINPDNMSEVEEIES